MRLALVLALPVALAGCNADHVAFQAVSVLPAGEGGVIHRNEEIAIQFSERLDTTSVSVESLRVTDEHGSRLEVRARASGDVLFISPADAEGWPADTQLSVEIPYPWLGRPIRSALGSPNEASFRATIGTGRRYGARGGALALVYHSVPFTGGTDVTEDAEFLFDFDGPVDAATLRGGIRLDDLTHGETAPHFDARVVSPRRVAVVPFAAQPFRSGTRFRLTLTEALRSEDARGLAEPAAFVFTTTRSRSGEHTTDFRPEHLLDPTLKPGPGPLVPLLSTSSVSLTAGTTHEQGVPFGRDPWRAQILIPWELLRAPDGGLENTLITAMSFRVFGGSPATLRLSARLDYAADRHADALGADFEENWNLPATRQRDLIGPEGALHVLDPQDGLVTFVFARPFFYEARPSQPRSLVLELVNESGILNESAGIALLGEARDQNAPIVLVERGDWSGEGTQHRFVPALGFSVQRVRGPVVLRPWRTATVSDPEYFRRQDQVVATPGFVDFQVEYRAVDAQSDLSSPEGYAPELGTLDGQRAIQARIRFFLRSPDAVSGDAGLLRLTVPFRERRE
jgi:hypothetical protein